MRIWYPHMDETQRRDNTSPAHPSLLFRASQALPSRDAKATQDPEAVLNEQYDAFFQLISEERRLQE